MLLQKELGAIALLVPVLERYLRLEQVMARRLIHYPFLRRNFQNTP